MNEKKDLLKDFHTYQDRFEDVKHVINENRQQYENNSEAKYDLATNVSVVDGMTNGAECLIKKIDYRVPGSSRPSIFWVLFQEQYIGNEQYSHLYNTTVDKNWIPILEVTRQFRKHQIQVLRR